MRMSASDRLRRSSGASNAKSRADSSTSTSATVPPRIANPPLPVSVPPLTSAVSDDSVTRS